MTDGDGSAFVAIARQRRAELALALQDVEAMRRRHDDQMRALGAKRDEALDALVRLLLPSLALVARRRAADLTGYSKLVDEDPNTALENERQRLRARLTAIEAAARFRQGDVEMAWRADTKRQLDELSEFRGPLARALDVAQHPRFARLLELGYGTAAYAVPFWRLSYYRDRQAAAEILKRLPGAESFADVCREYRGALEDVAVYDRRRKELGIEIAEVDVLLEEHAAATKRLNGLDRRFLDEWRARLGRHLSDLGLEALGFRFLDEPKELLLLKRWSGLHHQIAYMDQMATWRLMEHESVVSGEMRRLDLDLTRLGEGLGETGAPFEEAAGRRPRVDPDEVSRSVARLRHTHDKLAAFQAYDRGRLDGDFLWWDLMTDRDPAGDEIPEVLAHHRRQVASPATVALDETSRSPEK